MSRARCTAFRSGATRGRDGRRRNHGHQPRRLFREPGCWADAHRGARRYDVRAGLPEGRRHLRSAGRDLVEDGRHRRELHDGPGRIRCTPNVWYPEPVGEVTIEATTTNIRVDLVARLNAADGDVLGRCSGVGGMLGATDTDPGAQPGAADSVGRVDVGQSATVFFCVEKQSGTAQYTVSNSTARFGAKAVYV